MIAVKRMLFFLWVLKYNENLLLGNNMRKIISTLKINNV